MSITGFRMLTKPTPLLSLKGHDTWSWRMLHYRGSGCDNKIIKRSVMDCKVGLRVGGKKWTNVLAMWSYKAMKTMKQPTLDQRNIKSTKSLTSIGILPQIRGNELSKPFIHCFSFSFFLLFLLFSLFFCHF